MDLFCLSIVFMIYEMVNLLKMFNYVLCICLVFYLKVVLVILMSIIKCYIS